MQEGNFVIPSQATEKTRLLAAVRTDVNTVLEAFFLEKSTLSSSTAIQYGRLWKVMAELSKSGGKRLRPYMVMLAYQSFGGTKYKDVIRVAAAWELLHFCMLIHDDIIDNDLIRYGVDNVAGTYKDIYRNTLAGEHQQDHQAMSAAIIAGDLALSSAHEMVLRSALLDEEKVIVLQTLVEATFIVAGGQLLDTEAALYPMMEADPELIADLKTASYSFAGPLKTGAILAGAMTKDINDIENLSRALGRGYQLVDDLLGVFGNSTVTGKSSDSDITEGKRSFLIQQAFRLCQPEQLAIMDQLLGKNELTESEIESIRTIIRNTGAKKLTEDKIESAVGEASDIIMHMGILEQDKTNLLELVSVTLKRDR